MGNRSTEGLQDRTADFSVGEGIMAQRLAGIISCLKAWHFSQCPELCWESICGHFIVLGKMEDLWESSLQP